MVEIKRKSGWTLAMHSQESKQTLGSVHSWGVLTQNLDPPSQDVMGRCAPEGCYAFLASGGNRAINRMRKYTHVTSKLAVT